MTNCKEIDDFIELVRSGELNTCKEIKALVDHVEYCFENEAIYVDQERLQKYLSLSILTSRKINSRSIYILFYS